MAAPQDFTIEDLLADAQSSGASPLDTAAGLRKWRDDMAAYGRGKHDAEKYWEGIRRLDNDLAPVLENLRDQEANRIIGQLGENRPLFLAQYNKAQGNPDEMAPAFADQARALNALTESKDFAPERVGFASLATDDGKPLADVVVGRGEALVRPLNGGTPFLVPVEKRSPEEIAKLAEKYKADAATFAQAAEVDTLPVTPGSFGAQEGMQSYFKTRARQEQLKADAYATGDPTVIAGYDVGAAIKGQPELLGKIADKDLTDRFQSGLLKASINTARALDDLKDLTYNMGMGGPQDRFAGFEEALAQTNTDTARSFQATTGDTVAASATESLGQMAPTVLPYTAGARLGGLAVREGLAAATMAPASYGQELASMLESAKQAEAAGDPAKANQLRSVARWSAFTQAAIDTGTEMMFPELAGAATGGKGALKRMLTAPLKEGLEEVAAGGLERGVKQPAFYPTDMQQPVVEGMATEALAGMAAGGTMSTVQEGGAALLNRRKGEAKKAAVATGDAGTAAAVEEVFDLAQDFATLDSPPATEPPPAQAVVERDSRPEPAVLPPPESVAPQQVERTAEVAPPVEEPGALDAAAPPTAVEEPPAVTAPTPVLSVEDSNVGVVAPADPSASPLGEPITTTPPETVDPTTEGSVPGGVNDLGASTEGPATGSSAPAVSVPQQTPTQETVNVDLPHLRSLVSSPTIGTNALRHELSYYSPQEREWIARQLGAPDPSPNTLARMLRYQENGNERFTLTPDRPTANMTEAQARAALGNVPRNVTFINEPEARTPWGTPWAGKANRNTGEVTLNLANISDAADLRSRLNEELAHIVWQDPEVKAAVRTLEAAVTPAMRAEMARLGYDAASLTEEAAARLVDKLGRNPDTRSAWRRFLDAVKNALRRLLRLEPTQQQVEQAAREILTYAMSERPAQGSGEMFNQSKDADYLAAVERGDMETAQRMVDEAAKAAGYKFGPVVHLTKGEDFTVFDLSKSSNSSVWGPAIYAAFDGDGEWNPAHLRNARKINGFVGGRVIDATQPLQPNDAIVFEKAFDRKVEAIPFLTLEKRFGSVANGLRTLGFDAMIHNGPGASGKHIAVFNPNQIKSADPVTRDEAGNVIPLSQRFNDASDDIRYSTYDPREQVFGNRNVGATKPVTLSTPPARLVGKFKPEDVPTLQKIAKKIKEKDDLRREINNGSLGWSWAAYDKRSTNIESSLLKIFPSKERDSSGERDVDVAERWLRDNADAAGNISERQSRESGEMFSVVDPREQVFGNRNVGATKPVRSFVESMRVAKETYFDGSLPISESTTATAHRLAAEWADKHTGAQVAAGLLRAANGDELVIGAAQGELHNYAIKLAGTGDASLLNFLQATVNRWAVTDGNEGISSVAALLAGRRPYSQSAFMEATTQVGTGRRKAETTVLSPEVVDAVTTEVTGTKLKEKEVRRVKRAKKDAKGETLEDKVERSIADKSAEQVLNKFATSQSDTLSWDIRSLNKSKADAVRALIRAALETGSKVKQWDRQWLIQSLVDLEVTPEIAARLADTTWEERRRRFTLLQLQQQERDAKQAEKQAERDAKKAEREAKAEEQRRLANDRLAQSLVDKYAEAQSDTPKNAPPPKINEIRAIIREALETGKQAKMWEKQNLIDALVTLNVLPRTAQQLANVVWQERANRLAIEENERREKEAQNVAQKMADLASGERGSLSGLEDALLDAPAAQQQDPGWRRKTAREYFSQLGLSPQQAAAAARIYDAEFAERLGDALVAAVERVASQQAPWQEKLKKIGPKQLKKVQTDMDRLRRAVRVGVTHPDTPWHTALAKAHGWKGFTREQNMRLHEIDAQLARHDVLDHEKKRLLNEMQDIVARANMPPKLADYLVAEYVLSALSGLPTAFVQLSAVFSILRDFFSDVWTSPVVSARTLLASMDSFIGNLSYAGRNDVYNHQVAEHLRGAMPAMRYLLEQGLENLQSDNPATKAKGLLQVIVGGLHFVGQFLSAMDEGSIAAAEIYKLSMFTNRALKRLGWTRDQAGAVILASLDARAEALAEAKQSGYRGDEATVVADGIFRRRIHEGMSMADRNIADDIVRGAASEAIGMVGRLNAKTAATDIGSLGIDAGAVGNMDEGMLSRYTVNPILDALQKLHSKGGLAGLAARLAFGFVSVPFRAARWYSSYSPYGFVRYGMNRHRVASGKDTLWKQSFGTRAQEQQRLRDAIVGTLAQVLAVLARSNSGDDDPEKSEIKLIITGKGPVDDAQRMAWSRRFKPYTMYIKMGRTYVPFNMGRLGESVAWSFGLAGALDDVALTKKGRLARNPGLAFRDSAELFGSYYGSLSQRASFQSIGQLFSSASRGGAAELGDNMFKQGAFAASTFIPWKGALNSLTRMASEPVDQNTMAGVVWSNTPIVGPLFGRPALNPLGDPIGDQTLAGKLYREGFPLIVRFPTNGRDSRVYELILDQGFGPSDPRRYDLERRVGPVTPQQFYEYSRARGQYIKAKMDEQYQSLKRMNPEQYGSYIRRISENANAQAVRVIRQ